MLRSLKVTDVVKQSIELVQEFESFTAVLEKIVNSPHNYIYIIDKQKNITGYISIHEIRQTLLDYDTLKNLLIAKDVANPQVITVKETDDLDYVMKQFGRNEVDELPVIAGNGNTGKIVGTIWQTDVIAVYNHQVFLRDMSGEMVQSVRQLTTEKTVHVIDNYHFSEIEAPASLVMKTLEHAALRKRFNLEVLLIRRKIVQGNDVKNSYIQPGGQTTLQMNDILLVFGEKADIERFSKI